MQMFREIFTSRQNCSVYIPYGADWKKIRLWSRAR